MSLTMLRLLHLADSALPIGSTAHSFGLETLTAEGSLTAAQLEPFLRDYLIETGALEAAFCRAAYRLSTVGTPADFTARWLDCNAQRAAYTLARESRTANAALGRRFLRLVLDLEPHPRLELALRAAHRANIEILHAPAFGLAGGVLALGETQTALAYLQQTVAGLVSACQRLLPVGQSHAARLLWQLKPVLIEVAHPPEEAAGAPFESISSFAPMLEIGSMRHPRLPVRLFIS